MADRRPASMLPSSPGMEADFRSATEAMQKAAEAMIAATESFRNQFHEQQHGLPQRPATYHPPYATEDAPALGRPRRGSSSGASSSDPPSLQLNFLSPESTAAVTPPDTLSGESRPPSGKSNRLAPPYTTRHISPPTAVPAPRPKEESLPRKPARSRANSDLDFGAHIVPEFSHYDAEPHPGSLTPTTDWPVANGSTPKLAPVLAPAPIVPTGPRQLHRAPGPHVDLFEAANRLKGSRVTAKASQADSSTSTTHQSFMENGLDEPLPVVQIGRYTYVRSDTDEFRDSLIPHEEGPGRQRSHRSHRSQRRAGLPAAKPPSERPHGFSLSHEIAFVLVISLAQMLMLSGIAQALVPQFVIGKSFPDTTPGDLAWYSAAYGLTAGTFVLPSGRLGDLFGHKKIFIIGFCWFGIWELIGGFSLYVQNAGSRGTVYFIFCRAMQGIGPALLVPNGQAMLGRAYKPGPRKNIVMCLFGAAAPFGFVAGGAMASLFAVKASWPWAFWTMSAMCASLAIVSCIVLPPTEQTKKKQGESLWLQLDLPGMALGVSGLVLINFAFNQAPIVSWSTPYTYFLLLIGVLFVAAFIYTEVVAPHPLVPISAMRSTTNFVLGCTAAGWGCFSVWVYYNFSVVEVLRGWSPLLAAASHAHGPIAGLVASLLTGYLMGRVRPHWIMFASMCAFFTGSLLFATSPVGQSFWLNSFFSVLVMPFGMDMSNPAATILLSNSVSREHQGIAASLVVTVVNYSISLALGIAGTIETHANKGGTDILAGYRASQYFGLGLGGLGITIAAAFLLSSYRKGAPPMGPPGPPKAG
ncbi:MFS general substrate transporter [Pleurostoma richardsiae]|uniref:MFS general substrate transporter n=1 Tax=Pleurostoma richardsiae TaxID=41990 RepID=A0AA38RG07_9PEZI|nr:MFS general substrate transporter [Pleurostoma richardsiae]